MTRYARSTLQMFLAGLVLAAIAASSCSAGSDDETVTLPTRDPAAVAGREAAENWLDTFAGGLLVDEDAQVGLTVQQQRCVADGMSDLDEATLDSITSATTPDQIGPDAKEDLVEVLEGCSDVYQSYYEFLIAQHVDARMASCIARQGSIAVTWASLLDASVQAAAGQVDPEEMFAAFADETIAAWSTCTDRPQTSLPY